MAREVRRGSSRLYQPIPPQPKQIWKPIQRALIPNEPLTQPLPSIVETNIQADEGY